MKLIKFFIFLVLLCFFSSCSRLERTDSLRSSAGTPEQYAEKQLAKDQSGPNQQVSLKQAVDSQSMAEAMNIRNAELTLEVTAPQDVQRKISSIAESLGGFVVTSEAKQRQNAEGAKQEIEVSLVIRVPAAQFVNHYRQSADSYCYSREHIRLRQGHS